MRATVSMVVCQRLRHWSKLVRRFKERPSFEREKIKTLNVSQLADLEVRRATCTCSYIGFRNIQSVETGCVIIAIDHRTFVYEDPSYVPWVNGISEKCKMLVWQNLISYWMRRMKNKVTSLFVTVKIITQEYIIYPVYNFYSAEPSSVVLVLLMSICTYWTLTPG